MSSDGSIPPANSRAKSERRAQLGLRVLLGVLAVGCLIPAVLATFTAVSNRGVAAQFSAAPECSGASAPTADCFSWQTDQISSVDQEKSSTTIYVDNGAMNVGYVNHPSSWVLGLSAGDSVPVLVWEGKAQALRDPSGQVLYGQDSALYYGFYNIAAAVFCYATAVVCAACLLVTRVMYRGRLRQGAHVRLYVALAVVLLDLGIAGMVAGAMIQYSDSIYSGVGWGLVAYVIGGVFAVLVLAVRRFKNLRQQRSLLGA